jgi:plasmid stability protein
MAQLIVRNLDPELVARLKRRATAHGRREIISFTVSLSHS